MKPQVITHLPHSLRPKGVDVDKPTGTIKRGLRRWWRAFLKRCAQAEAREMEGLK